MKGREVTVPSAVEVAATRIRDTQARCGTRLCQVDPALPGTKFGYVQDIDVDYLVKDVFDALSAAGYVIVNPQDEESMRAAGFHKLHEPTPFGLLRYVWLASEASEP
jgi:hypothetical protein